MRTFIRTMDTWAPLAVLARRAVDVVPYRQLRTVTDDPTGDHPADRQDALGRAEVGRRGRRIAAAPA